MFEPDDFLNSSNESVLDTKYNLLPEMEVKASIPLDDKALTINKGEKDGKPWAQLAVRLEIQDPLGNIEKELGRKPAVTDRFFLDLDDNGKLDMNKQRNIRLGQYLAACGCKSPWKLTDLKGKTLKCKVIQVKSDLNPGEKRNAVSQLGIA